MRNTLCVFLLIIFLPLITGCASTPDEILRSSPATASITMVPAPTKTKIIPQPPSPETMLTTSIEFQPSPTAGSSLPVEYNPSPISPNPTPTLAPRSWRLVPVIPTSISQRMVELYQLGQELGNNPRAFSKVGDCQTMLPDFLGDFDNGRYNLGEYEYLQMVVDQFSGSFGRFSRAVKDGLTASGVMATLWNTWKDCNTQETPLECEYRIHRPSFVFLSLGTNDANGILPFEDTMRRVIDVTLVHGIVPILVTKADNAEGDWSINASLIRLANEYQIPVWNFWLAVQPLPERGLRSPEHLTYGEYTIPGDFSTPENMQYAFNVRNLDALQVLDVVWRAVTGQSASDFVPTPFSYLP